MTLFALRTRCRHCGHDPVGDAEFLAALAAQEAPKQAAPVVAVEPIPRWTQADADAWGERHDLKIHGSDLFCAFEDAATLHLTQDEQSVMKRALLRSVEVLLEKGSEPVALADEGPLIASSACPHCGYDKPHGHTEEQLAAYKRDRESSDGYVSTLVRQPPAHGWYLCKGVKLLKTDGEYWALNWSRRYMEHAARIGEDIPEICYWGNLNGVLGFHLRHTNGSPGLTGAETRYAVVIDAPLWKDLASPPPAAPAVPEGMALVPIEFLRGFHVLAHNYSLKAEGPDYYHGVERDAFSNAYRRCGDDLAKLRALLAASQQNKVQP